MIRNIFVILHRWGGLLMAGFLIIVGLTGSLLAFHDELDHVFARELHAAPRPGIPPLDFATLMERAPRIPHAQVKGLFGNQADRVRISYQPEKNPSTGKPYDLGFDQLYVDPWTGAELGRRTRGDFFRRVNFVDFLLKLHVSLLVSGTGTLIVGIVAVLWTLDCFNGFYLALPVSFSGFWRKWKTAWLVTRGASFDRTNFNLHRASGLWLWPVLFIFALSSVMFNLRPVYDWTMSRFMQHYSLVGEGMKAMEDMPKRAAKPVPALDPRAAVLVAQSIAAEKASTQRHGATEPVSFNYVDRLGVYAYETRSSALRDGFLQEPQSILTIDGDTGAEVDLPVLHVSEKISLVDRWLEALHKASVFGLPYKMFVCVLGFVVAMLSATGVYVWWEKRAARRIREKNGLSAGSPTEPLSAE